MEAMSGPEPGGAAVPNFCTKLADGTTVTLTLPSCVLLYSSASRLMNAFSLSRAHSVAVPVGLSVALVVWPPLEHPATTRTAAVAKAAYLRFMSDRFLSGDGQPDAHRARPSVRPGV